MSENIIINDKVIAIPSVSYTARNANSILLSGYILHTLDIHNIKGKADIRINPEHKKETLDQLQQAESSLFLGIHAIGDIVSAADYDRLEDKALANVGYLLSTVTNLLQEIQETRNQLIHSFDKEECSI